MKETVSSLVLGICNGGIYSLLAVSYVVIYKSTRVFPFSQAAVLILGAYIMWYCLIAWHLPIWLGFLITCSVSALLGIFVERAFMRRLVGQPILAPIVVTLCLMLLLRGMGILLGKGNIQGFGESFLPVGAWRIGFIHIPEIQVFGFILCTALIGALMLFYEKTRVGLAMRIVHEDHVMAQCLGLNVRRVFQYSWVVSCVIASIAGMLLGNIQGVGLALDANGLVAIAAVLFGGLESFAGAIIAGLAIGILQMLTISYIAPLLPGETTMMIPFILLLLVLFLKPYGLFGLTRIERL
ncbi:MAG TPA: branched-chain amino acid ABC transporter permease [Thermodesulfobacteriota bacterium]|nr:branched-chain amino acid ABC transporter permease [Thermodesulfobacteriota bacterium]